MENNRKIGIGYKICINIFAHTINVIDNKGRALKFDGGDKIYVKNLDKHNADSFAQVIGEIAGFHTKFESQKSYVMIYEIIKGFTAIQSNGNG